MCTIQIKSSSIYLFFFFKKALFNVENFLLSNYPIHINFDMPQVEKEYTHISFMAVSKW